ncbi:MAG: heavy-metal-associated domain-containing protein [Holophagales bacterium]|nr:heavy-metal-associated domain-containing protein [Holophagales bacterium]
MTTRFRITPLHWDSCVKFCTLKFTKIEGVSSVMIDLASGDASVESDRAVLIEQLQHALEGTDYTVSPVAPAESEVPAA